MNKIFKELSLEAGGSFYPDINPAIQQKFAELIVTECIRYFNAEYHRDFSVLWHEDLSNSLLKHFEMK